MTNAFREVGSQLTSLFLTNEFWKSIEPQTFWAAISAILLSPQKKLVDFQQFFACGWIRTHNMCSKMKIVFWFSKTIPCASRFKISCHNSTNGLLWKVFFASPLMWILLKNAKKMSKKVVDLFFLSYLKESIWRLRSLPLTKSFKAQTN